ATNNSPEFTGRLCPAPCEAACVLEIREGDAVTIKQIENAIINRAFEEGWVTPQPPRSETGQSVAVVGSGPAGMAAAQQLRRAGHRVTLLERDEAAGGLFAMDYLYGRNRARARELGPEPTVAPPAPGERISAQGRDVVVIGGGDTGADCVGNALREGARSITQLELLPEPPPKRPDEV